MRVYVEQFGRWWSFDKDNWVLMLKDMLEKTVDFDDYGQQLKSVPYHKVSYYRTTDAEGYKRSSYYPKQEDVRVYEMLCDWDKERIEAALEEVEPKLSSDGKKL